MPGSDTNAKVMERTADFCNHIANILLKHPDGIFDDPTALHTAGDVLDSYAALRQLLVEGFLLVRQRPTTRFLEWCDATYSIDRERQEAQILQ